MYCQMIDTTARARWIDREEEIERTRAAGEALYENQRGRHGVGFTSSFAPQGASSSPPSSCWGSPSEFDKFELAGWTKSHENRTSRGRRIYKRSGEPRSRSDGEAGTISGVKRSHSPLSKRFFIFHS